MTLELRPNGGAGSAFITRQGNVLRCGGCDAPVGILRWDGAGWPHPVLRRSSCADCGRRQVLNLERLESVTLTQYGA
jgi:hypothetical protein